MLSRTRLWIPTGTTIVQETLSLSPDNKTSNAGQAYMTRHKNSIPVFKCTTTNI